MLEDVFIKTLRTRAEAESHSVIPLTTPVTNGYTLDYTINGLRKLKGLQTPTVTSMNPLMAKVESNEHLGAKTDR